MNKILKITSIIIITLICLGISVQATNNERLLEYVSKEFDISGEKIKVSESDLVKVERYLAQYPISEENEEKIIAKIDEAVKLMNGENATSLNKLSKAKKDELIEIAKEIAVLADATLTYDANNKLIAIYKNGKLYDTVSLENYKFVQTGNDDATYSAIITVAIIAIATASITIYKRVKTNG